MATLLSALAGPLIGALVTGLAGLVTGWIRSQEDQKAGADQASAAVAAQSAATQTAVAKAAVDAPSTTKASEAAMDAGTF